ncbi:MAG TPA: alpha-amylase family glycosyl hydrolase [Anaeromyxobacteraceae bacterium]|nr:alpha-amylase family glycosyl hydrolase [Anaeromyxobacteraceae bacterium]
MRTTRPDLVRLLLVTLAAAACSGSSRAPYPTPSADVPLGVAFDPATGQATFRVWAPAAPSASVLLFDAWNAADPSATAPMEKDLSGLGDLDADGWNGVWQATVGSVAEGRLYQYSLGGGRALDPYAPSMGRFDSSTQSVGMGAVVDPGPILPMDANGHPTPFVPFDAPPGYARREDAVIYEVHVRDFTIGLPFGAPAGLANPPGTYRAFAERLDHVVGLGATHVQLLPVLAYYWGDESRRATREDTPDSTGNNYNWGYDPQGYFAPEGMYSADPKDPVLRVKELKTLVNEAHRKGLGVLLDVVYNHTATTAILGALAPGYYYRGSNHSGVGNDTASERRMMRRLIVDSVRHWVEHYRVDGFRFDLMGLIDSVTIEEAYAAASAVNPHVLFVGEGWRMGGVPGTDWEGTPIEAATQDWMDSTDHAAVFSDTFRDIVKGGGFGEGSSTNLGFITTANVDKNLLLRNLRGDPTNFAADDPGDAVQYLTAHDGLTLHDKIGKVLNLDPDAAASEAEILKVARLGLVLQATAQGIAFVHAGCEMGRTKRVTTSQPETTPGLSVGGTPADVFYVYNSYDASDGVNMIRWGEWMAQGSEGRRLYAYASGLFALRRSSDAFRLGTRALATTNVTLLDGTKARAIAYQVAEPAGTVTFSIFVNADTSAVTLATVDDLQTAAVVVDSDEAGDVPVTAPSGFSNLTGAQVTVAPRTAVVFRRP